MSLTYLVGHLSFTVTGAVRGRLPACVLPAVLNLDFPPDTFFTKVCPLSPLFFHLIKRNKDTILEIKEDY